MQIKVLFDKLSVDERFLTGWGFSTLVDDCILFDTGEKPSLLLSNMESLGVDISSVRAVVISHDHWDHTGGLWNILSAREELTVYACPGFSADFKSKVRKLKGELIELDKVTEIAKGIYSTGEIPGDYKGQDMPEQALVVRSDNHEELAALKRAVKKIQPDRIQLNTPVRPPQEKWVKVLSSEKLLAIKEFFGDKCEIIAEFKRKGKKAYLKNVEDKILILISRRPVTCKDMSSSLGLHINEVVKYVENLEKEKKITSQIYQGKRYFAKS